MINKTKIDNVELMLSRVRSIIDLDPVGRINNFTGTTKTNGAQHTINFNEPVFKPLLDTIIKIAPKKFAINDVWTNVNYPTGKNNKHTHIHADIAGCLYLYVPENSGEIEFESGEKFFPTAGDVYWWDASLPHWVYENKSTENRISIAFNIKGLPDE
jgi:hypothetical protein